MADIIDYLSQEDLAKYRRLTAIEAMLTQGRADVHIDDAAERIAEAWEFVREIQQRYDIDPDDSFDIRVYDGAIVREK